MDIASKKMHDLASRADGAALQHALSIFFNLLMVSTFQISDSV